MSDDKAFAKKTAANIYRKKSAAPAAADLDRPCRIKSICQTCTYINAPYQESLQGKWQRAIDLLRADGILGKAHVVAPVPSEKPLGYRNHAKLAVRKSELAVNPDQESRFAIGLFRPGSHDVVDITDCPLHRHTINALIRDLKAVLHDSPLQPYDETSLTGDLRYLAIRSSHLTEEIMVTFVMTSDSFRKELKNIVSLLKAKGHQIQASFLNINPNNTNVIFGEESKHLTGANRLRENICELAFEIGPTSFFQVNPGEAERIYRRIEQLCGYNSTQDVGWDLYCGVGQISLLLARRGYRVLGVEMNPQSIRDAQRNAATVGVGVTPTFLAGRVEHEISSLPGWAKAPKLIITNPARKGLDASVRAHIVSTLKKNPNCEFIYMSCEMASLARDLKDFAASGLSLKQIEAFDMFPFTEKLEWLAVIR